MYFRFLTLACLFAALSVFAQTPNVPVPEPAATPGGIVQSNADESSAAGRPLRVAVESNVTGTNGDLLLDAPPSPFQTGVVLRAASGPMGFFTGGGERMRIFTNGHIGIGGPYDNGRLGVYEYTDLGRALTALLQTAVETSTSQTEIASITSALHSVAAGATNSGTITGSHVEAWNFDAGTISELFAHRALAGVWPGKTGVITNAYGSQVYVTAGSGAITNAYGVLALVSKGSGSMANGFGVYVADVDATNDWGVYQAGADDTNYFAGNVAIGTTSSPTGAKLEVLGNAHVTGNVNVSGSITGATVLGAVYQDVAEWVPATTDMEPGTVVVLNLERTNEVMPSRVAYDTGVAGVVSAQPGILLGVGSSSKEQIATTGRVRVRVDASSAAIRVGDLLVTSDIPGTAMRSQPTEIAGRRFHQPGTIVGKALEPLESGQGEILVLLSLQ